MVTGAFVGAFQIDTAAMETDPGEHALIHIWRTDTGAEKKGGGRIAQKNKENHKLLVAPFS